MFKFKKSLFSFLLIMLGYIQFAFASNSINMLVKFDVPDSKLLSYAYFGDETESYIMTCAGLKTTAYPNGYQITGATQDDKGLEIGVTGPFPEDSRNTCKLYDQHQDVTNQVYFIVESLPITFFYNDVKHTCNINQQVGTSFNLANRKNNKLQGQNTKVQIPCNGLVAGDTYTVNYGTGDDKGNITITVPKYAYSEIKVGIVTDALQARLVESVVLGETFSIPCAGLDNLYTSITPESTGHIGNNTSGYYTGYSVYGPFNGDKRQTCSIYDQTSGHTNQVYFVVESIPVYYKYDGIQHSCFINQKLGNTYSGYDDLWGKNPYSRLYSGNSFTKLPCNGLVESDTYEITNFSIFIYPNNQ